jgi:hypothetical protein
LAACGQRLLGNDRLQHKSRETHHKKQAARVNRIQQMQCFHPLLEKEDIYLQKRYRARKKCIQ